MQIMKSDLERCSKCFITLKRLKEDDIASYLLKIYNGEKEDYICPSCFLRGD